MKLESLQYFVMIAQTGSIAKAAARLSVNRSTMSMALSTLEDQLGTALFIRTGNSMQLAPAGEKIIDDSIRLINLAESIKHRCLHDDEQLPHRLVIGRDDALPEAFWREIIRSIRKRYPGISLEMHYASANALQQMVEEGFMDLACCLDQSLYANTQLPLQVLGWVALHMVIAKDHPLTQMRYVSNEDLASVPQIAYLDLSQSDIQTNVSERYDIALSSFELIRDAIRDKLGWGYVPEPLLKGFQPQEVARIAHGYNVSWHGYVAISQQVVENEQPIIRDIRRLISDQMVALPGIDMSLSA
ncbi:LysR family transcriptional regulator [Pseudoalteromonas nigrifaciens]|uniref:LysR family transcriptional regulator n=1 Tax=Pseudoalteromonas nigrifaciens TaxID=28109 RepID=UPI003F9C4910